MIWNGELLMIGIINKELPENLYPMNINIDSKMKISRIEKSNIYCSGIQILNPYLINKNTKKADDFNQVWKQLIPLHQLKISNALPDYWYAIDNLEQLKFINDTE